MRQRARNIERQPPPKGQSAPLRRTPRRAGIQERAPSSPIPGMGAFGGDGSRSPSQADADFKRDRIAASGRPLRVVVVEDDALIAMELERMLQDLGAEVLGIAITAAEAVRLAERHRPDCATVDISIKGDRDGVSAAIEIYETLGIRSIFVSAYGNEETRARAAAAHPFGWVKKPFNLDDLRSAMDRIEDGE